MSDFSPWCKLKEAIHGSDRGPNIKEREIWWCSLGLNIGNEMNGKHELFHRPVLVLKKLSHDSVLIAPITSKIKQGTWYVNICIKNEQRTLCIHQIRIINTRRFGKYLSRLPESQFEIVKKNFQSLYF
jgi:mRNA interferase MazF